MTKTQDIIDRESRVCAPNYHPIPVVLHKGEGVWLWDVEGNKYLDMMSAYSAVSLGHANPEIVGAMTLQAQTLAVPSRAFHSDKLAPLFESLCRLSGMDLGLPMNTGAEGVETAIKACRRWGYQVKGIPEDKAEIIVARNNFHGRTSTIIGFSTEASYRKGFGPFDGGFRPVPFGDIEAFKAAITPHTAAFLVEPIQGEAGIIVPPEGWLRQVRQVCDENNVLLVMDEVQTGLCRTGKMFAFQHEGIQPDGLILGKTLGGGVYPVSAFLAKREVLSLMTPGSHGSTFGGNPLACTIGLKTLEILEKGNFAEHARKMGEHMMSRLRAIKTPLIREVRGRGLLIGVDFDPAYTLARPVCLKMMERGVLSKETHETVVRLAPALVIQKDELDFGLDVLETVLKEMEPHALKQGAQ